jgi:hypothetical protein
MDPKKVIIGGIALIVIVVSIGLILRGCRSPGEEVQSALALEMGTILGDEIIRQLDADGSVVVITRPMGENVRQKAMEEVKSLRRALEKDSNIEVKSVVELTADDYSGYSPMFRGRGLPLATLLRLMDENPGVDALVSLAGQPLMHEELEDLPETRPKIFCLAVSTLPLRDLFEWSVVDAAVVKGEVSSDGDGPRYEVITQETVEYLEF